METTDEPVAAEPVAAEPLEACAQLARVFEILGKRWNALILDVVSHRPARFSEIHRAVPRLSDRVLGERLHELVEAGVVARDDSAAGAVVYTLTPRGRRLMPGLEELRAWAAELSEPADADRDSVVAEADEK